MSTIDIDFKNTTKHKIQDWTCKTLREGWVLKPEQRAQLAKKLMDKLNNEVDPMLVEFIMQIRSRGSCDRHRIGMLGDISDSVHSIEDFINYLDKRWDSFPGRIAEELKRDGNVLTAYMFKCPCDFVNRLKELVPKTYCNCFTGFYRSIFEEYFSCEVKAEAISSIISGTAKYEIKIVLPKDVLKE